MIRVVEVCAGIGGISKGLEAAGDFRPVAFVEIDDYATRVLAKHWPDVPRYSDLRRLVARTLPGHDMLAGGIPCQPHSVAGKRRADADERDLWPDFYRLVCANRPKYIMVENVTGLLSSDSGRFFGRILRDLAGAGYNARWGVLSACAVGAPHMRERVFIVAYANSEHGQKGMGDISKRAQQIPASDFRSRQSEWLDAIAPLCGDPYGVPSRVDRIRCLGNAVVPACATAIGRFIWDHWLRTKEADHAA